MTDHEPIELHHPIGLELGAMHRLEARTRTGGTDTLTWAGHTLTGEFTVDAQRQEPPIVDEDGWATPGLRSFEVMIRGEEGQFKWVPHGTIRRAEFDDGYHYECDAILIGVSEPLIGPPFRR